VCFTLSALRQPHRLKVTRIVPPLQVASIPAIGPQHAQAGRRGGERNLGDQIHIQAQPPGDDSYDRASVRDQKQRRRILGQAIHALGDA
jgi:hypothetical protein